MGGLPALRVGYQYIDPGPPPLSPLYDDPPSPKRRKLAARHAAWRQQVEAHQVEVNRLHQSRFAWRPVSNTGLHAVVPFMGGTTDSWDSLVAGLTEAAVDTGFETVQVANLSGRPVLRSLFALSSGAQQAHVRFDRVSSNGSSLSLFQAQTYEELASFVADVLRVTSDARGRRDAGREASDLRTVASLVHDPVHLAKLTAAIEVALGSVDAQTGTGLATDEERALQDFHYRVVAHRSQTADRLDGLHADLSNLVRYDYGLHQKAQTFGDAPSALAHVWVLDVERGQGRNDTELARALIAASVARAFGRPTGKLEFLLVAGAENLAPEVLDDLKSSAEHEEKQLVLLFGEITPEAERTIGSGGHELAAFMRLPNANDAEIAARHFGREFKFVVSGITITEGQTQEWNSSHGSSTEAGTSFTPFFGLNFGTHLARSFGNGTSETSGQGYGINTSRAQQTGRVHEYVIEPEEFQRLEEYAIVFADGKQVTYVNGDHRVRHHPNALTS